MKSKEKQVQIPFKAFAKLLILTERILDDSEDIYIEEVKELNKILNNKLNSMVKRKLYTTYKIDKNKEKREKARIEYLKKIGINKNII